MKKINIEDEEIDLYDLISNLPGYVYWKNNKSEYIGANKNLVRVSNLKSSEEMIGKRDEDFGWGVEQAEIFRADDRDVMQTAQVKITEHKIPLAKGDDEFSCMVVRTEKRPLRNKQGEIIGVLGVALDITELKKMEFILQKEKEAAEAANKAKTEFLQNMRHDLRTPLSGIVGFSELLQNEEDNKKVREYTYLLAESCKELHRFLNEILESINVASGEIPILKQRFSLQNTISNVIKLHQPKAIEKQLKLEFNFDSAIPKYIIGDSVRIYRIVLELLVNALKFTQHGKILISVKLVKNEDRNLVIKIEVEDTGVGVPVEKQQELFMRFRRLAPSYQGIYKGSGLGLFIIKQFIDDLEGEIYLESQENKGSKFICLIPVKEALLSDTSEDALCSGIPVSFGIGAPETEIRKNELFNEKEVVKNQKHRILVVEDNFLAASVAKELFEKLACHVDLAQNGKEALQYAQLNKYDLILMDIGLPDMDGFEVSKKIRLGEPSSQTVPIVGLTGHLDAEKKQQSINARMNAVMIKPLTRGITINLLKNFIPSFSDNIVPLYG